MFPGQCHTDQQWYQRTLDSQGYGIQTLVFSNCCATFFWLVKEVWIYFHQKMFGYDVIHSSFVSAQEQVDSPQKSLLVRRPFIFVSWVLHPLPPPPPGAIYTPTFCQTNVDFWSICISQMHMRYVVNIRPLRSFLQLSIGSTFLTMYVTHTVYTVYIRMPWRLCIVVPHAKIIHVFSSLFKFAWHFSESITSAMFKNTTQLLVFEHTLTQPAVATFFFAAMKQGAWNITKVNTSSFIPHGAQLLGPLEHEKVEFYLGTLNHFQGNMVGSLTGATSYMAKLPEILLF